MNRTKHIEQMFSRPRLILCERIPVFLELCMVIAREDMRISCHECFIIKAPAQPYDLYIVVAAIFCLGR